MTPKLAFSRLMEVDDLTVGSQAWCEDGWLPGNSEEPQTITSQKQKEDGSIKNSTILMLKFPGTMMQVWVTVFILVNVIFLAFNVIIWTDFISSTNAFFFSFSLRILATTQADLSVCKYSRFSLAPEVFVLIFFFFLCQGRLSLRDVQFWWSWSRCRQQKGVCGWPLIQTFPCLSHPALATYRPTTYQALIICMRSRSRDHTPTRRLGHRKEKVEGEHNHHPATDSCSVWCCSWRTVHLQTCRTLWMCSNWSAFIFTWHSI